MDSLSKHLKDNSAIYLSLLLIISILTSYFIFPPFQEFLNEFWQVIWSEDHDQIVNWFDQFGFWGPLLILFLMSLQMFLIVFPSFLPMIVAVIGYGEFWGVVISVVGVFIASTLGYFIGEKLSNNVSEHLIGKKNVDKMSKFMKKYGFWAVVLFRISPFLSNDAISFVAGIIKMGYKKYILATMVGIIPLAIAIAFFAQNMERLEKGLWWIGGFGVLIYGIYLALEWYSKKAESAY